MGAFTRQLRALAWKNVLVFAQRPLLHTLQYLIIPIAYGVFLGYAQVFLARPNYNGIGEPIPVTSLSSVYDGTTRLYWSSYPTNGSVNPALTPDEIMARVTKGFSRNQLHGVTKVDAPDDISPACVQNFNGHSRCFASVTFNPPLVHEYTNQPNLNNTVGYLIQVDAALRHIDVRGQSDYERRMFPLQFALDQAITELSTNVTLPIPMEWQFTQETNEAEDNGIRLFYVSLVQYLVVLPMFIAYVGIAYTLPGAFGSERASLLTSHLKAMGLRDLPRILSWLLTHTLFYLPAWIIVGVVWHYKIFTGTNVFLVLIIHLLLGLVLASHSLLIAVPFGKSPQLAAVMSTIVAIASAVIPFAGKLGTGSAVIYSLFLPGGFYTYAIRCIAAWELQNIPTNALKLSPQPYSDSKDPQLMLLPLLVVALVDVLLYPWLAVLLERRLYDAQEPRSGTIWNPFSRSSRVRDAEKAVAELPEGIAISIRHLHKTYAAPLFRRSRGPVNAVSDLSIDVPSRGIFILLGSNGAGKSSTLSVLGGLLGRTSGEVVFANGHGLHGRPKRGDIGIVPQKNVLFDGLTCLQNLQVWRAVKRPAVVDGPGEEQEDLEQLLRDCDLGKKVHERAGTLSGGQKRKLQLAAGLVGGSSILLVDECTSGVDPLSRRALWRILRSVSEKRTIILTTHFLDEADLLGDTVAVLATPGKLVAQGTPVELKSSLGSGYAVMVTFGDGASATHIDQSAHALLESIKGVSPLCQMTYIPTGVSYQLGTKDPRIVQAALREIEAAGQIAAVQDVDVQGATLEGVFLDLMAKSVANAESDTEKTSAVEKDIVEADLPVLAPRPSTPVISKAPLTLNLASGRPLSFLQQTLTIFYKRVLIARRAWLTPVLALVVAILGACIPLSFVRKDTSSCARSFANSYPQPVFLPLSFWEYTLNKNVPFEFSDDTNNSPSGILEYPPGVLNTLGSSVENVSTVDFQSLSSLSDAVKTNYRNLTFGGISFDFGSNQNVSQSSATFAWQASADTAGLVALNLVDNILYNRALNVTDRAKQTPTFITASYASFPYPTIANLVALKWVAFFGLAMAVYPAFFSMYVSRERRAGVQAMQLSNGLSNPAGLWLGHLMFDSVISVIGVTIITIVFAATTHNQFHGLGLFWLVMVLYGVAATLFAYCITLIVSSPLAAFAATAGLQVLFFILYIAAYFIVLTYAATGNADYQLTVIHFTMSLVSPVGSVMRAAFVSVNLFLLLCSGDHMATSSAQGSIMHYGGPILYLIGQSLFFFALLIRRESGPLFRRTSRKPTGQHLPDSEFTSQANGRMKKDVAAEAQRVAGSDNALQVMKVTKSFNGDAVVKDVSFGVEEGSTLALLGPNGAGKTTTFNMIRGDLTPTTGQILVRGKSIISQPRLARASLGVCPQFSASEAQLSVAEHLVVYGRLKGLRPGAELRSNVDQILRAAGLEEYRDRDASRLSGGNQRKLSLAIALMGNPSVVLIDEFSSGVDAKMKREMWDTLKVLSANKAVVITTHSMEEASALATRVVILSKRVLAVGTVSELEARYANYEVHFSARTRQDALRAREIMTRVPSARPIDDVATRFGVHIVSSRAHTSDEGVTLEELFGILAEAELEFAVERPMLESVFLKVIGEHNVEEEDEPRSRRSVWATMKRLV